MTRTRIAGAALVALGSLLLLGRVTGQSDSGAHHHPQESTLSKSDGPAEQGVMQGMSHHGTHHDDMGPMGEHMQWTTQREPSTDDRTRAETILDSLRESIEKYKDYRVALKDGYRPFHPERPTPETHFTNYGYGFLAAFHFDASRPTSLLYRRSGGGWELLGAMFTAPASYKEDQLNERVPLGVAHWHLHVNICLPAKGQERSADWKKFGPGGSISTKEACDATNGRFLPHLFGWMVHVYPYEKDPAQIWAHPMGARGMEH
jgi:hypothetical protein